MTHRICSFPDCGRRYHASGYCSGHYQQQRSGRRLAPLQKQNLGVPLADRFAAKVDRTKDCWVWTGATNHLGYGQIWVSEERRVVMAHRVSLILAGVPLAADQDVDHLCRNPPCVNPEHLEPVTHAVNMQRAPWTAIDFQAAKTHCPHGHEYTPENTYLKPNKAGGLSRECRTCKRARSNVARDRRTAARRAE